jgi:hypothetical protein
VDEHQRLADAAVRLLEAICVDFSGDMPRALNRLAEAVEQKRVRVDVEGQWADDLMDILEQG